ncbi:unnamed protein product [Rhizophagus irregularis]|nr:unnamed protein product [Rhizophagus irregularis]
MCEGKLCLGFSSLLFILIAINFFQWGPLVEVDFDEILRKTENIFTNVQYDDLPAYSELIENRIAVTKLANLLSSNIVLDNYKKNIYDDLTRFDSYLNLLSKDLESIYEKGNEFFLTFVESVSEWEKVSKMDKYSPVLFNVMRNVSRDLSMIIYRAKFTVANSKLYIPSNKSDSVNYDEKKKILPSQWLSYLEIGLWCDISIIKECKYELSRVKNIVTYINKINLENIPYQIWQYSNYLDFIMKDLEKDNIMIKSSFRISNKLGSLINKIKSNYNIFLKSQDVFSKFNDNSSDTAKNVDPKIFKSEFIGENGCRAEFMTYFGSPPAIQGARKTKSSLSLRSIIIGADMFVDSLTFEWSDNISIKYGGNGGQLSRLKLEEGEVVMWANIYKYKWGKICGLEFRTNKWKTTGILGWSNNLPTALEAPRGYEIVGFYGSFDKHICGIGILYSKIEI